MPSCGETAPISVFCRPAAKRETCGLGEKRPAPLPSLTQKVRKTAASIPVPRDERSTRRPPSDINGEEETLIIRKDGKMTAAQDIWRVYLSGEIHTDWREEIAAGASSAGLPVKFDAPVTHHEASDDCGVAILGEEPNKFWHDHKGAKVNAIRTRTLIEKADIVVIRFGEKYKQWNAAFDAGMAAALGKSVIVVHQDEHAHALKEVDAAALAVCKTSQEVVAILRYVIGGALDGYTDR